MLRMPGNCWDMEHRIVHTPYRENAIFSAMLESIQTHLLPRYAAQTNSPHTLEFTLGQPALLVRLEKRGFVPKKGQEEDCAIMRTGASDLVYAYAYGYEQGKAGLVQKPESEVYC